MRRGKKGRRERVRARKLPERSHQDSRLQAAERLRGKRSLRAGKLALLCERRLREVQHRAFVRMRMLAGVRGERDNLPGKFSREKPRERCSGETRVDVAFFRVKRL